MTATPDSNCWPEKFMNITKREFCKRQATIERIGLPPFDDINRTVLNHLLDPQHGLPYAARAVIRTQLGMPAETNCARRDHFNERHRACFARTNAPATNSAANNSSSGERPREPIRKIASH